MSEIRKILIWPLIEEVLFQKKCCTISTLIDTFFVKNLLKTLGLNIESYKPTDCTLNFNVKYKKVLAELVTIIDDDSKLIQFQELINKQDLTFWLFLFTIPTDCAQSDFINYFSTKKNKVISLHMVLFFRNCFRDIFIENNTGRDGLYQDLSEDAKLILVDSSHTLDLYEFYEKLVGRILKHGDTLQYFWTRIFLVEYGRYI